MSLLKLASTVFVGVAMTAAAYAAPEIGQPAPQFTATDSNGKTISLNDYKGKIVVLEWTNDGCPYVKKHYSSNNMQNLQKEETNKGVIWLSIISSAQGQQGYVKGDEANELTQSRGAAPTEVLLDPEGKIGHLYDARTTPHMFVINPTGQISYMGGIDDKATTNVDDVKTAKNYVKLAIDNVAAGKPVENDVTKPYGCSVKYGS